MAKQTVITAEMLAGKTKAELVALVIAMSKPATTKAPKATKTEDTRTWKQKRADFNAEHPELVKAKAAYVAYYNEHFTKDWAKVTSKMGKRTSEQNKAIAKRIRNAYRAQFGLDLED